MAKPSSMMVMDYSAAVCYLSVLWPLPGIRTKIVEFPPNKPHDDFTHVTRGFASVPIEQNQMFKTLVGRMRCFVMK